MYVHGDSPAHAFGNSSKDAITHSHAPVRDGRSRGNNQRSAQPMQCYPSWTSGKLMEHGRERSQLDRKRPEQAARAVFCDVMHGVQSQWCGRIRGADNNRRVSRTSSMNQG